MSKELFVPQLGQTVEQVTIVNWLVEDGAKVKRGQEVLEVETDKAVFPIEANANGIIHIGPYPAGTTVPVLTVVAIIGTSEDVFLAGQTVGSQEINETPPALPGTSDQRDLNATEETSTTPGKNICFSQGKKDSQRKTGCFGWNNADWWCRGAHS